MAEAYLKKFGGDMYHVESAGLDAGKLNPLAVEIMREDGIDISNNQTHNVTDFFNDGKTYDYVITVCDAVNAERCPVFPGQVVKTAWWFDDPSLFEGSNDEKIEKIRAVRDKIRQAVLGFIAETNGSGRV